MTFTAIVPVRGGSKGLVGKNLRPLAGTPLWRRAVDQALAAGAARVVVTTDIREILDGSALPEVECLERPDKLAEDSTPMAPVVVHAIEAQAITGRVVLLQPTSPLRLVSDISAGVERLVDPSVDLVMSVTETDPGVLKYGTLEGGMFIPLANPEFPFTNRQSLPPVFRPNGAVYTFDANWFVANGGFATDRIAALVMPAERSHDIDTLADFERAEAIITASGARADR